MKNNHTVGRKALLNVSLTALFAALIAAGTFVAVPIGPVPIVLQNMLVLLAGLVLGPVRGGAAAALYVFAGAIGLPVFAGGTAGIARLMGPTGGFLIGYIVMAVTAGFIAGGAKVSRLRIGIAVVAGILVLYIPGLLWLKYRINSGWAGTFAVGFVPFIIGDAFKGIIAFFVTPRLRKTARNLLER